MKKTNLILLLVAVLVNSVGMMAAIHYVSYSTGSDTNNGTSTGTPWKHAPGMLGLTPTGGSTGDACASNCASYTPVAGDFIILKGGDVWPYTVAPWNLTHGGSSSTTTYGCAGTGCVYVGNAVGAGLAAWNNGTVVSITLKRDLGGWNPASPPTISCSGGGGTGVTTTLSVVPSANLDANVAGFIYHTAVTGGGSGYTSAPDCVLTGGSGSATLVSDIDRAVFDLGATQGSPPDWPMGQCSTYSSTCSPGLNADAAYLRISGIEVRNLEMQQNTFGGLDDSHQQMVQAATGTGHNVTFNNMYAHGLYTDCYAAGSCSASQDDQWDAFGLNAHHDEASFDIDENGDTAFLGTSGQQSSNICNTNKFCSSVSFGYVTTTQSLYGPESIHDSVGYSNFWQLRFVGNDTSGSDPYLSYDNEFWLTTYAINFATHINSRYMQLASPATLYSYNNIVHSQVAGTSSQIQCPSGAAFYFYNEKTWGIGTGTQPYGLDMADVGNTGGCSAYFYNDTAYSNNGVTCVGAQSGSNTTTIVMQNLFCITTPSIVNPFWTTASNAVFENYAGTTTQATVQASSVVDSISSANSQGYMSSNLYSPTLSSNDTVTFSGSGNSANLTALCSGNLAALCSDISGNARPASGGWQAGADWYPSGSGVQSAPCRACFTGLFPVFDTLAFSWLPSPEYDIFYPAKEDYVRPAR